MAKRRSSKDELYRLYWIEEKSLNDIARMFGVDNKTVRGWFKRYDIKTRSISEARKLDEKKKAKKRMSKVVMDNELMELIDGLLLGDANIAIDSGGRRNGMLQLTQSKEKLEWLEWLKDKFLEKGVYCNVIKSNEERIHLINGKITKCDEEYVLFTGRLTLFTEQRKRWYPDGVKRVPEDVRLTPLSLAMVYMGDGSLAYDKRNRWYSIKLCLNNFEKEEVEMLAIKLRKLYGWDVRVHKANVKYWLHMGKREDVYEFLKMTEKYAVDCLRYKWRALEDEKWVSKIVSLY